MTDQNQPVFSAWMHAEFMGHQSHWGLVSEQMVFGKPMVRVDVFVGDASEPSRTKIYNPDSIYCLEPCEEQVARNANARSAPSWMLEAGDDYDVDDDEVEVPFP